MAAGTASEHPARALSTRTPELTLQDTQVLHEVMTAYWNWNDTLMPDSVRLTIGHLTKTPD